MSHLSKVKNLCDRSCPFRQDNRPRYPTSPPISSVKEPDLAAF
ncbi:hypothetical protein [Kovacikia minuta]|nr:hypothetical protein [Kovacikia minuta]